MKRELPKTSCQQAPIAIPRANIPTLKTLVCHHFNVNVLNKFMRPPSCSPPYREPVSKISTNRGAPFAFRVLHRDRGIHRTSPYTKIRSATCDVTNLSRGKIQRSRMHSGESPGVALPAMSCQARRGLPKIRGQPSSRSSSRKNQSRCKSGCICEESSTGITALR
jgi:hypothetical protein